MADIGKKVYQYDLDGNFIAEFNSINQASDLTKTHVMGLIKCLKGKNLKANNFYWSDVYYMKLKLDDIEYYKRDYFKNIFCQFDLKGKFIKKFYSCTEASKELNIPLTNVGQAVRGDVKICYGYIFLNTHNTNDLTEEFLIDYLKIKPIYQYDLDGNFIAKYNSGMEAHRITKLPHTSITQNLRGEVGSVKNKFVFSYNEKIEKYIKNTSPKKPVAQYDLDGKFIKVYISVTEAHKQTKISDSQIVQCCKRKIINKTAGGFIWRYYNDSKKNIPKKDIKLSSNKKCILQYDLKGNLIKEWDGVRIAARGLNFSPSYISNVLNNKIDSYNDFVFKYK
jgi:hypothetical protein